MTAHTVTHHVQGSITRDLLVGKDLPRKFEFAADELLIIRSARADEHWSVTWEHYQCRRVVGITRRPYPGPKNERNKEIEHGAFGIEL